MEKGYWSKGIRAKEGAYETIDNATKFALDDSDYEEFEEWVEYTAEEYAEGRIAELKRLLADTDYISAKIMDSLVSCENITDFLSVLASFRSEYADKIAERKAWRDEINELSR